ncbi:MAG: TIM barrel protein, partial [Angelakisella sp.]
ATMLAKETLKKAMEALDGEGLGEITVCPETMGKINQLGTLDEVLELCTVDDRLIPCIDFGHLNARTLGGMKTIDDFRLVLDSMGNVLGRDRQKVFHSHFSKIEYTENGGEKRHLTFEDKVYGPNFDPLAELIVKYDCTPVIICESAGTQSEDAATMKEIYLKAVTK